MTHNSTAEPSSRPVRDAADAFVGAAAELNPLLATMLGLPDGQDRLPDLSPAGQEAQRRARQGHAGPDLGGRACRRRHWLRGRRRTAVRAAAAGTTGDGARDQRHGRASEVGLEYLRAAAADARDLPADADCHQRRLGGHQHGELARSRPRWQGTGHRWLRAPGAAFLPRRGRWRPWPDSLRTGWRPAMAGAGSATLPPVRSRGRLSLRSDLDTASAAADQSVASAA